MVTRVLIIDDEVQIRRVVRHAVEDMGGSALEAADARAGIDAVAAEKPDLVILDLGLPGMSGLAVCRELRLWSAVPIIVLSARHGDQDKVALLDAGADDYLTKPFSPSELQARIRAQIRRAAVLTAAGESKLEVDGLLIDSGRRTISRNGEEIHLTPTEWDLLRLLIRNSGRTMTHAQIFERVWPRSAGDAQAYLRVHVSNLRRKLERDPVRPRIIMTEPGVGYRFRAND